jgi:sugar/nucleoside kinase (ribokinase family)
MLADIIKADNNEIERICDYFNLSLEQLQQRFNLAEILITKGSHGGFVSPINNQRIIYTAYPVKQIVDTTGAGDIFFAAYVAQRYHYQNEIQASLNLAAKTTADYLQGMWTI